MKAFKDCLKIVWSGKQTQYSQPQDLVRSNSFEQKKVSPFGNGTARLMFCIHLYWNHSFCSRYPLKTQPYDIFARIHTTKCITGCNHNDSLEDDHCIPFLKLQLLIPTSPHVKFFPSRYYFPSYISPLRRYRWTCLYSLFSMLVPP